jgi:FKBP12-rapamycin complex-associated protein
VSATGQQQQAQTTGAVAELPPVASTSEEYNPTVVISALLRILRDPNLSVHHRVAVRDLIHSLKSLGMKFIPFLPYIVKQHIRDYLDQIFGLMCEFWDCTPMVHILTLAEEISLAINDEFKAYLPTLIPLMLRELASDRSARRINAQKVIKSLETFGTNLDDYLHLVVPAIVTLVEADDTPAPTAIFAIQALRRLCRKLNFSDLASRIVHPFVRLLERPQRADLREEIMRALCTLVRHLGTDYAIFIPMVSKVLARARI